MHGLMQNEMYDTSEALERRRWERRVEERTRELVRRQQVAESLRNMLAVLNSGQPLEVILDHIVAEASSVLNAEAVAIYIDTVSAEHLGLAIMRERAEAIGAKLSISSKPGQGAQVTAVWRDHGDGQR